MTSENLYFSNNQYLLNRYVPKAFVAKGDYELVAIAQDASETQGRREMARRTLLFRHLPAIKNQCRKYTYGPVSETMMQYGCQGLLKAINRFDLNNPKQVKFITYAWWRIRKSAQQGLTQKIKDAKTLPLEEAERVADTRRNHYGLQQDVAAAIRNVVSSEDEVFMLQSYYGLEGNKPKTLDQIAQTLGRKRRSVQIAIRHLRAKLAVELKDYACK